MRKKLGGALSSKGLPKDIDDKRKAVIRDWWRLVVWFIRLRKAAKGAIPKPLLDVEERIQRKLYLNGVMRVKQARL